jgi:hypothetical protein
MVKRIAMIFHFFVFIYWVLIPLQAAQSAQVDNDRKFRIQKVILKLEEMRNDAEAQIKKSDEIIGRSQNIISRARAAGNAKAEEIARQALLKAQEAKKKDEWRKATAEEWIDKISKGAADDKSLCSDIEAQLERDKEAIRRYHKTIETNNKELQDWAEKNKRAEEKALEDATAGLFGLISNQLLKQEKIADHIQKRLTEYQVRLAVEGWPKQKLLVDRLIKKTVGASVAYAQASAKADTGKFIEAGLDIKNHYDAAKAMVDSIQAANEVGNKEMKEVMKMLEDPENGLRDSFSDLISLGAEERLEAILEETPYLSDLASFTLFLRDYGYDAVAWNESRKRILERLEITDLQLKAVAATGEQIKRTMDKLKECRKVIE